MNRTNAHIGLLSLCKRTASPSKAVLMLGPRGRGIAQLRTLVLGALDTNCYIFRHGGGTFVVDPADDGDKISAQISPSQRGDVLITHGHFDHIIGLPKYMHLRPECKVFLSRHDMHYLSELPWDAVGPGSFQEALKRCQFVSDGESVEGIRVIATPGHTPGSVSYYVGQGETVFVGDTLFRGSVGNCDFAGGDFDTMMKSIKEKLLRDLPDFTRVLPGHGLSTTIGLERRSNPFLRSRLRGVTGGGG